MKLQKVKPDTDSNNRKMVHVHGDTHLKLQQLALYTGRPITELVEMLLTDALSRIELVESEDKNEGSD